MKIPIVLCVFFLAVFILMTIPAIPAVQYQSSMTSYKIKFMDDIKSFDTYNIRQQLQQINAVVYDNLFLKTEWELHPLALLLAAIVFVFWLILVGVKGIIS